MIALDSTSQLRPMLAGGAHRLHHIGMVVPSIREAATQFERWLGLQEITLPFDDNAQRVRVQFVHAGMGTFVELIEPIDSASPVERFLKEKGGGLHHLAFEVADLDRALEENEGAGGRRLGNPWIGFENRRLAFLIPRGGLRLLVELVETRPSDRGSDGAAD
jgi:methylmalonyl-CoA/ethylmalonyl-CoA epimerase